MLDRLCYRSSGWYGDCLGLQIPMKYVISKKVKAQTRCGNEPSELVSVLWREHQFCEQVYHRPLSALQPFPIPARRAVSLWGFVAPARQKDDTAHIPLTGDVLKTGVIVSNKGGFVQHPRRGTPEAGPDNACAVGHRWLVDLPAETHKGSRNGH